MQLTGDILVLAVEAPYESDLPANLFMFIDVSDPENPSLLSSWESPDPGESFSAALVGIAAVETASGVCCRYVMVAAGKENKQVRFFRSLPTELGVTTTDSKSPSLEWEETGRFSESEIEARIPVDWHTGGGDAHQSLSLVRETDLDGPLYMIGARNDTPLPSGDDKMDLYSINLDVDRVPEDCFLDDVDTTHFHPDPYMGGGDSANFTAACGVYISPTAELIVYAYRQAVRKALRLLGA